MDRHSDCFQYFAAFCFVSLAMLHSMSDLSSGIEPTVLALEKQCLNHWTAREVYYFVVVVLFLFGLGLFCCAGFSLVGVSRGYSLQCSGFSSQSLFLWGTGSRARGLQ